MSELKASTDYDIVHDAAKKEGGSLYESMYDTVVVNE